MPSPTKNPVAAADEQSVDHSKTTTQKKDTVMKIQKHNQSNLIIRSSLASALALAIWFPVHAQSAEPAKEKMPMEEMKMEGCKAMMEKKQEMMKKVKAQDAELSEQAAKMNSAPADEKTGLMAGIVTQLVEQRMARDEAKAKMQEKMMKHMMQHMQMGKESMEKCPMMKDMKDMDEKSGSTHKEHHEEKE
jgi:hypothetical protein